MAAQKLETVGLEADAGGQHGTFGSADQFLRGSHRSLLLLRESSPALKERRYSTVPSGNLCNTVCTAPLGVSSLLKRMTSLIVHVSTGEVEIVRSAFSICRQSRGRNAFARPNVRCG